jgi:hypothetical protein
LTTIAATAPSIGDSLAQLISGGSSGPLTPAADSTDSASSSTSTPTGGAGPATVVTLSDQAKAAVAKAQSDQAAADRLQAYVEAHRVDPTKTTATDSLQSILDTNTQPADPQPTTGGSKVEAIVAQIKTLASANAPPPFQAFTPTKSPSNSVTLDGFTLTVDTNASTQFYGIQLSGSGTQFNDRHFGPSDEWTGGGGLSPDVVGVGISSGMVDNNEALDAITVTQNIAMASSASSSSSAGPVSTSSVNAQSSSITFLVNYATGQIGVQQSAASVSAQSTSVGSPGSTLSTFA